SASATDHGGASAIAAATADRRRDRTERRDSDEASVVPQPVTHAPHGLDEVSARAKLAAQVLDVSVDGALVRPTVLVPGYLLEQLRATAHVAGRPRQSRQQPKLAGREVENHAVASRPEPGFIYLQSAHPKRP